MLFVSVLIYAIIVSILVHVLSMAFAGWVVGAEVKEVSLFSGPNFLRVNRWGIDFKINYIPMGGSVQFGESFQSIHPIKRIFISIAGCLGLLVLAVATLGFQTAYTKFYTGFQQIIFGALSPLSFGSNLFFGLNSFMKVNTLFACIGVVAAKFAACNLLPLPVLNGGDILLSLIGLIKPIPTKIREYLQQVGLLIVLALMFIWVIAFCYFLYRLL